MKRAILAFLVLGLVALSCTQPNTPRKPSSTAHGDQTRACIDNIIAKDDSLGKIRNHACETISMSKTILNYVGELEALDFRGCPNQFVDAFTQHRLAWIKLLSVTDKYPDLRGELHDLFKVIEQGEDKEAFQSHLQLILDTWEEVKESTKD